MDVKSSKEEDVLAENNLLVSRPLSFPKTHRLLKRKDFEKVQRNRVRLYGRVVMLELLSQSDALTKMGVVATKKYGKSHDRNRFKRCVREAFRLSYPSLPKGYHIVIRPKRPSVYPKTAEIKADLLHLLSKNP